MNPIVSVLMTSYNREKYIGFAIDSVLASSLTNFELIITDDGSKDRTVDIVRSYAAKDPRVKLFINEKNLGDYPNRNQAASHASGKYLKYVDADDYIYPWGLQHLVEMMEAHPEAGWGLCSLIQIVAKPYPFVLSPKEAYLHHYNGGNIFVKAPLSAIVKKELFDKVEGFKPGRMVGDFEMWHRLAANAPVLLMPDGMVWYREHDEQEMNSQKKYLLDYEQVKLNALTAPNCPLGIEEARLVWKGIGTMYKKAAIKSALRLNFGGFSEYLKLYSFNRRNKI